MKKLLLLIDLICCIGSVSAQTKTAYCDVYMRGGYDCMTVTIMFDSDTYELQDSYSIGEILNILAEDSWVLDREIVIPRHPLFSLFTRHKLHLIMKKEYTNGDSPFKGILEMLLGKPNTFTNQAEIIDYDKQNNNAKTTNISQNIGHKFEYNGVNAIVIKIIGDQYIIAATGSIYGTWDEAMAYCQALGSEWRLPSCVEFNSIYTLLQDNRYWSCEEIDENKAKFYNWATSKAYDCDKSKSLYILPIATIDADSIDIK